MNANKQLNRLFAALGREGLEVSREGRVYRVRRKDGPEAPAEVLLPDDFPVEAKALRQLAGLMAVKHPCGGSVEHACASPDFHPGDAGVAIGSVAVTRDMVIPAAVGSDINCGMRLHVIELAPDRLLARRDELVELLKGDFFFGTRDLPMTAGSMRALFHDGLLGWIDEVGKRPLGVLAGSDFDQLTRELDRVHLGGALAGHAMWAPEDLVPEDGGQVRDGGMATIGGGNHFVEIQVVEAVEDGAMAHAWGVRAGQLAVMIHSGSRGVGKHVGAAWRDKARAAWPKGQRHPEEGLFALSLADHPELVAGYLQAEATAANYGFVNRLLLAELIRLRMRQVFGAGLAAPLVYDLPHNITLPMDIAGNKPDQQWVDLIIVHRGDDGVRFVFVERVDYVNCRCEGPRNLYGIFVDRKPCRVTLSTWIATRLRALVELGLLDFWTPSRQRYGVDDELRFPHLPGGSVAFECEAAAIVGIGVKTHVHRT
mgnify:CR=1 FL=1